jgi:hypothetical protein
MTSFLLLSLVLSAPAATAQARVAPNSPIVAESAPQIFVVPESQPIVEDEGASSFDAMEIHPDGDICFKIRAYVFSTGPVPKLQRETTCGPKRGVLKSIDRAKPKLEPIDAGEKPAVTPER